MEQLLGVWWTPLGLGMEQLGLGRRLGRSWLCFGLEQLGLEQLGLERLGLEQLGLERLGLERLGLERLGLEFSLPL